MAMYVKKREFSFFKIFNVEWIGAEMLRSHSINDYSRSNWYFYLKFGTVLVDNILQ